MTGYICAYPTHYYRGYTFEITYSGPWQLRLDGMPYRRRPSRAFWAVYSEWESLPEDEKQKTRVGGGCVRF